jgi:hypothetical protein
VKRAEQGCYICRGKGFVKEIVDFATNEYDFVPCDCTFEDEEESDNSYEDDDE